jgi:hypothetical protein
MDLPLTTTHRPVAKTFRSTVDGLTIGILYRDVQGEVSDRVIRCHHLRHTAAEVLPPLPSVLVGRLCGAYDPTPEHQGELGRW